MAFEATVLRVLIASPSDVDTERKTAQQAIQNWNTQNSADRNAVLLPIMWETGTAPSYGERPQAIINHQIVDNCDMLVGIFWTRLGSPTGAADSGTLEEIDRVAESGKPVLLYFSNAMANPNSLDIDQLQRLREFRQKTHANALVGTFSSPLDLSEQLTRQIDLHAKTLLSEPGRKDKLGVKATDIHLQIVDELRKQRGNSVEYHTSNLDIQGMDEIPDFVPKSQNALGTIRQSQNEDFFREYVEFISRSADTRIVHFGMKNVGSIGARDVFVRLRGTFNPATSLIAPPSAFHLAPPPKNKNRFFGGETQEKNDVMLEVDYDEGTFVAEFEIRALQPQRDLLITGGIAIFTREDSTFELNAEIYADMLPTPQQANLTVKFNVIDETVNALDLLESNLDDSDVKLLKSLMRKKTASGKDITA